MRITLVVDNLAKADLKSEHGLSFLVETDNGHLLFDTGQSDAWLHNLLALGRKPDEIKATAVSHGHYDHTGGLARALKVLVDSEFYAHPACFQPKYAQSNGEKRYIGMPPEVVSRQSAFTLKSSAQEVMPGVTLSGEIPLRVEVELSGRFVTGCDKLVQDTFVDEQCVVVQNDGRAAVLVGCAHRGLENNVLAAMDATGSERIDLLAGGFHLGGAGRERLESLAGFLSGMDVARIACCHCTGIDAYEYLRSSLGSRVTLARAGVSWTV